MPISNHCSALYRDGRAQGGFEAGVERALKRLLVSPEFLYRVEVDPPQAANTAYRVSDLELASRLSFFLWSSIPDDELLELAVKGRLRNAAVLAGQVKRMLADPRSDALVQNFAGQWLFLRNVPLTGPTPSDFPDFDDTLRQAFRRETELFFESILREDRSALDLLRADYTFLNERLALHYGIRTIKGSHFRRVTWPGDSVRRGLLGHGSILTLTSYPDRTSPVVRGKWILENVLGTPPPPPLPDVGVLNATDGAGDSPVDARAPGPPSRESRLCELPLDARPARPRARELRRRWESAGRAMNRPSRSMRRPSCRMEPRWWDRTGFGRRSSPGPTGSSPRSRKR